LPPCAASSKPWKPKPNARAWLANKIAGFGGGGSVHHALTPEFTGTDEEFRGMIPGPSPAAECHSLFVYGTFRHGFERHHHLARLGAKLQGEARVAAELYDLGRYPGARPASGRGKWVRGEVFELRQPAHDLRVLDQVEDFVPAAPARSEFIRAVAEMVLANGTRQTTWIYWLTAKARGSRRRIACGDYAKWRARQAVI